MKSICLSLLSCILVSVAFSQQNSSVAIGSQTPKDNAVLFLNSPNGNQGFIIPVGKKGLIAQPQAGMMVFDVDDNLLYYHTGTVWLGVGTQGNALQLKSELQGNALTLLNGTTVISTSALSLAQPSAGNFLTWNGSAWTSGSFVGDVTRQNQNLTTVGLMGKSIPTLPAATRALSYSNGAWVFLPLGDMLKSDFDLNNNNVADDAEKLSGETNADLKDRSNHTGTQLSATISDFDNAVSSSPAVVGKLNTGSPAGGDLSGTYPAPTIAALAGTNIITAINDATTTGKIALGKLSDEIVISSQTPASGDIAGNFDTGFQIGAGAVSDAEIGNVGIGRLLQNGASNGQILKWNGTQWSPQADNIGAGSIATLNPGEVLLGDGATNFAQTLSGDATINSATGAVNIANDAVTTIKIVDNAVTNTKISSVSASKITGISNLIVPRSNTTSLIDGSISDDGTNIGIGTNPLSTSKIAVKTSDTQFGLLSENTRITSLANLGIRASSAGSSQSNTGIIGYGINGLTATGVSGVATGTGSTLYGVKGDASGNGNINYGVYGSATGNATSTNWAGYFLGNAAITGALAVGATNNFGTIGQVLTSNGTGAPSWNTPSAGTDAQDLTLSGSTLSLTNDGSAVILGALAIANAVSGGAGGTITDATITSADLANGSVSGGVSGVISDASITDADLANGSVTGGPGGDILDNSITSSDLTDGTVAGVDLANGAVSGGPGGVISDATITNADISNTAAIAVTKINPSAIDGQVLTTSGGSVAWAAPPAAGGGLSTSLLAAQFYVGDASNVAVARTMTGDLTLFDNGSIALDNDVVNTSKILDETIDNVDIHPAAAIAGSKINPTFGAQDLTAQNGSFTGTNLNVRGITYTWPAAQGTASTVLTNDGTGVLSWAASGGGGGSYVTTANVVPRGNGTELVSSNILDNGSTTLVGSGGLDVNSELFVVSTSTNAMRVVNVYANNSGTSETIFRGEATKNTGWAGNLKGIDIDIDNDGNGTSHVLKGNLPGNPTGREYGIDITGEDENRLSNKLGIGRPAATPLVNMLEVEGSASKTTAAAWLANSDRRIKTDIQTVEHAIETIMKIRPVKFKYTDSYKAKHPSIENRYYHNFIAQEYQQVFPDAVQGSGEFIEGDSKEILQIDTYDSQIVLIRAVQEQQQLIEQQSKEISQLKEELSLLKGLKTELNDIRAAIRSIKTSANPTSTSSDDKK